MKLKYYIPTHFDLSKSFIFRMLLVCCIIFYTVYAVESYPIISIYNNTKTDTNSSYGIYLNSSESVILRANTTNASNTWRWYVDDVLQVNNYSNKTVSFSTGTYHYVVVNTTFAGNTSNTIFWGINVYPEMATSPDDEIVLLNETPAEDFENAMQNNDFPALVNSPIEVYVNLIGLGFYAFLWLIVFAMQWIKQASINIPAVIGVIFGGLLVTFLPPQYQLISQALIVFGIFAVIYIFYKGRG